jgi:ATP-dependent Clp protease ATP-binding subunit ClpA
MQISILDPTKIKVEVLLGCPSRAFGSALPRGVNCCPSGRFIDAVISPWGAGPWAIQSPSWDAVLKSLASTAATTSPQGAAVLLLGEPLAVEQFVKSAIFRAGPRICVELDLSRAIHSYSISMITGSDVGYIGYSPDGSDFSKSFAAAAEAAAAFKGSKKSPCPVLIFHNIHRAAPEVQNLVAQIAKSRGLTLPGGKKVQSPALLVLATAPGLYPSSFSTSDVKRFVESTTKGQRLIFDASLSSSFHPMAFPAPSFKTIVTATSMIIGNMWCHRLPAGTFVHPRIFAGPRLTSAVISHASKNLHESDTSLAAVEAKIKKAALEAFKQAPNAPLPNSLVVPNRWGIMVEWEADKLWAEPCASEEIARHRVETTLPSSAANALRIPMPLELLWTADSALSYLQKHVIGQEKVIHDVVTKIQLFKTSPRENRPLFSALLLGSTGTGKTHLSKMLSRAYDKPLAKVDCSTLQDNDLLQEALFGMSSGSLASQLAVTPSAVILLDEVDKAHESIWFLLMQALDEGEMRADGRPPLNLRSCVFLATSNQLAAELSVSFDQLASRPQVEIDGFLRNALFEGQQVNEACVERFDAVYLLPPLKGEAAKHLWKTILLEEFRLRASEEVINLLSSHHEVHAVSGGARAIKRACSEVLAAPHEWGLLGKSGELLRDATAQVLTRRQKLWKEVSQQSDFVSITKGHWSASLLQDLFRVNANKANPRGPQCLILFAGPASAGKAKMAKELSVGMGKGEALVVNCSQFESNASALNYLLGDVDRQQPGCLSAAALAKPDRVILLTDIDRAPVGVVGDLLTALSAGGVLDRASKQLVDMKNTAIFLTSAACSTALAELDRKVKNSELSPADACGKAEEELVQAGSLSPESVDLLDIVVPCADSPASAASTASTLLAKDVTAEFDLPPEAFEEILKRLPDLAHRSISQKQLRREMEKIASDLAENPRAT